jgi:ankyrin repeat protein
VRSLLKFDSQDANSADFQGNTPLHCAAATLNAEAYANILRKSHLPSPKHAYFNRSLSSNGNEPSHCSEINPLARNKLDLIPLILSFPLPPLMRPQPLSQPSFASNILIHYSDEDHKKFLIILEQTIAFKNNIPSKTSLCPDVLELNSASNRRSDSLKPSFYRPQSLPAYMPTNSRDRSELENYKSRQGWNLLHYAAVYGHSRQAYEIVTRLPSLFTEATLSKGAKLPLQYAFFLKRYDVAKALIAGWIHQAKSTLQPYKELARLLSAFKIDLGLFLTEIEDIPSLKAFYAELCISQQLGQSLSPASAKSERFSFRAASLTIRSSRARIFLEKRFDIAKIAVSKGQVEVLELFDKEILDLYDHQEETILIEAVKHLQINCIQYLVKIASEHHKFLNSLNLFGQNALHTLCCIQRPQAKEKLKQEYEKRNVEVNERRLEEDLDTQLVQCFRLLLQAGIDLSAVDETGNNCFHLMAAYNHVAMLEYWKQSVIEEMPKGEAENKLQQYLGATNDDNRSPIFMSVANSSQESFEWLLNNSKQLTIDLGIRSIDIFGFTLAIIAAQEGNLLILEKLLPETELDQVNDLGETALSAAAFNRRLKTVEYLLKMSSSSLSFRRPNHMGRTALHQVFLVTSPQRQRAQIHCNSGTSSLLKHEEVAGDFSEYTRSTNSSSSSFSNSLEPLDLLLLGDLTILLLKYKFNLYDQDKKGMSVWHYLCRDSYFELFERFIQNELKVNPKKIMELVDFSGNTLLHSCCTLGSLRHLKKILFNLKPASLDQKNIHGFTPIHLAIKNQQWDCANFLLENNANITKTTRSEAQRRSNYPKSNNILHLIFSHISPITSSTLEFVKKIIKSKPQLLEQPNEKNELVLELCVQSGHYQLIPLICSCMKDQNKLIQSLEKCHKIAYHAPRSSIIQSSDFYTVLKYGQLHELVGKSFKGIIKTINFESSIPTFEFLLQEAKLRTQSQKSVSI